MPGGSGAHREASVRALRWHGRAILEHDQATMRAEAIARARSDGVLPDQA